MNRRGPAGIARAWRAALAGAAALLVAGAAAAQADCPPPLAAPDPASFPALQAAARDHGGLWRIERPARDGQPAALAWLYGTLHVGRLAWAFPGPRLLQALREAEVVALELVLGDPAVQAGLQRGVAALREAEARQPLAPALREKLAALARAECAEGQLATLPALLQLSMLPLLAARRDGLESALGQEMVLTGFARAAGKPLESLESAEGQLRALLPDDPADLPRLVERGTAHADGGALRRLLVPLAEAWAAGDLDHLARYEDWCECVDDEAERRQMARLLTDRNLTLAEAIDARAGRGQRLLAAVGVLHMTGEGGVPVLLARRGWTVERLWPP